MRLFRIAITLAAIVLTSALAWAAALEKPPSFDAGKLLGAAAQGPGYRIANPVTSDGYLRNYTIVSAYGTFYASGDLMLAMRTKELVALNALNKTASSQSFAQAMLKAGLSPVEYAGHLVTDPLGTVKNTFEGIGQTISGVAAGINNPDDSHESTLASLTGQAQQKRLIAYQYGVDPYTDFKPLADKLDSMANAAAAGKLAVSAAFMVIPGAVGTIVSNVSTANDLNDVIRDNSAAQLIDLNEAKLAKLGINRKLVKRLIKNKYYTPVDVTVMADALARMGAIENMDALVERAATATSRDIAYFIRERFEMIAAYQQRRHDLTAFVQFGAVPFPLTRTAAGGLVGIFPFDILSWTSDTSRAFTTMTSGARSGKISGPKVLYITGTATPLAMKELKKLGWKLEEKAPL